MRSFRKAAGLVFRPVVQFLSTMAKFPITQRPMLRLRPVRLPDKLRPRHEPSFPVPPGLQPGAGRSATSAGPAPAPKEFGGRPGEAGHSKYLT
jgi:hypothetical protein